MKHLSSVSISPDKIKIEKEKKLGKDKKVKVGVEAGKNKVKVEGEYTKGDTKYSGSVKYKHRKDRNDVSVNGGKVTTTSEEKKFHTKENEHGNVFDADVSIGKHGGSAKGS